jgi:hypothetical protein
MICRKCGGTGELLYFDHTSGIETSETCTSCHWNGVERVSNYSTPHQGLNPIEAVLKTLAEHQMKLEAKRHAIHDRKRNSQ